MEYLRDRNDGRGMKDSFLVGEHACAVILFADLRDAEDAVPGMILCGIDHDAGRLWISVWKPEAGSKYAASPDGGRSGDI